MLHMHIIKKYEITDSNGKIWRYDGIKRLTKLVHRYDTSKETDYYIATEIEYEKNVIINDSGDVIWESVPGNIESYIVYGNFIFFVHQDEIKGFGVLFSGEKKIKLFKQEVKTDIASPENKIISKGICIYGNVIINVRPLIIYRGMEEVFCEEEEISNVQISLKNISNMNAIEIYFETSDKKNVLFFDLNGEELELKLVPKKQE